MKEFWRSMNNKILVARKKDTGSIVGYAIFSVCDLKDPRFGKNRVPSVYLLRIGVRSNSQRQGIGRKLMAWLFDTYPQHALSLDVSTDNTKAVKFYGRVGLKIQQIYMSPDNVEFALFETPLDKKGKKLSLTDPQIQSKSVQPYFDDVDEFKQHAEASNLKNEMQATSEQSVETTSSEETIPVGDKEKIYHGVQLSPSKLSDTTK